MIEYECQTGHSFFSYKKPATCPIHPNVVGKTKGSIQASKPIQPTPENTIHSYQCKTCTARFTHYQKLLIHRRRHNPINVEFMEWVKRIPKN